MIISLAFSSIESIWILLLFEGLYLANSHSSNKLINVFSISLSIPEDLKYEFIVSFDKLIISTLNLSEKYPHNAFSISSKNFSKLLESIHSFAFSFFLVQFYLLFVFYLL